MDSQLVESQHTPNPPLRADSSPRRMARTLGIGCVVSASLLSFPSVTAWMTAFWLGWHTWLVMRGRPAWLPLATCLAILVIKLVARTPLMLLFGFALLSIAVLRYRRRDSPAGLARVMLPGTIGLWVLWIAMLWEQQSIVTCNHPRLERVDLNSPIVCVGDSLTDGLLPDGGYPDQLREMVALPVINEGFSGIATSQGLDLMSRVLQHQPSIVVIELGGHDFLKGRSRQSTKTNLLEMIDQSRAAGAEVVLMEIPRGFMLDPFASLEREIAYEKDVQLVADTWLRQVVLMSPIAPPGMWMPNSRLSDDGIHSNTRGSRVIARRVADSIQAMLSNIAPGI